MTITNVQFFLTSHRGRDKSSSRWINFQGRSIISKVEVFYLKVKVGINTNKESNSVDAAGGV